MNVNVFLLRLVLEYSSTIREVVECVPHVVGGIAWSSHFSIDETLAEKARINLW